MSDWTRNAKRYIDCPNCGEIYHTADATGPDQAERPCGCTAQRVPTTAELAETGTAPGVYR